MFSNFEKAVTSAVQNKDVAGGAVLIVNKAGETVYTKEFGKASLLADAEDFTFDTTYWLASSTKLLTAIAACKCVELGLLKLDDPAEKYLPQLGNKQVLHGFADDGTPILKPATNSITMRRLLTHSSGFVYASLHPEIDKYLAWEGKDRTKIRNMSIEEEFSFPLIFNPGEAWFYGGGIDWAGKLIEKVSGKKLGEFMRQHIWKPLGMTRITFAPLKNEDFMKHMAGRVFRDADGKLNNTETAFTQMFVTSDSDDDYGGAGAYSCAKEYIKVLTSVLTDDGKLLSHEMREELLRPQTENPAAVKEMMSHPIYGQLFTPGYTAEEKATTAWDYALAGAVVVDGIAGHSAPGTVFWSGMPNNYWFIDRETGNCGYYATWILPPGDEPNSKLYNILKRDAMQEGAKL